MRESVFDDDPLRLLRAVRLEDELDFRLDEETERLVREHAALVTRPAGERILAELRRLSAGGYRRLDELGLLEPLGGSIDRPARPRRLARLPARRRRSATTCAGCRSRTSCAATRGCCCAPSAPEGDARSIHRFRRATEPWALDALAFLGAGELAGAVEEARRADPAEPLVRGDELGLPPGPEIGRLLDEIAEERAAGTIATKEEALDYARRNARAVRQDG